MKKINNTARSEAFRIFRDKETDWTFRRTLEFMNEKAAEIGECLCAARRINETDGDSWIKEWRELGNRVRTLGDRSLNRGHVISARECYMRASNYYRTAEYGTPPTHPEFDKIWKESVESFRKGADLFSPKIQLINIHFDDKDLPGYFWRPVDDNKTRPTLIAAGGNDSSLEELVWWVGMAAIRRGYNFFTFEHPGHRGALHLYHNCIKRHDYEKPYKTAIDYLETLPGVDSRLVMTGYSFGGYVTCRVAAYEKRLKAIAPNSPIIDVYDATFAFFDEFNRLVKLIKLLPDSVIKKLFSLKMRKRPVQLALKQYTNWSSGMQTTNMTAIEVLEKSAEYLKSFTVKDRLDKITCPAIGLAGIADGEVLLDQAKEFVNKISSIKKKLHIFALEKDGSNDHCQLDNRSRGSQVMFDFFDEAFRNII